MVSDTPIGEHVPSRLRVARRDRGLTQEAVAEQLGVARTTIVAIEKGERRIRPEELRKLAMVYGRQVDELLRPTAPVEDLEAQFRVVLPKLPEDLDLAAPVHVLEQLVDDYLELERLTGSKFKPRHPPEISLEGVDAEAAATEAASAERNRLGLGDAPIPNLRDVLEAKVGMRVFALELPSRVAGLFAYDEGVGACVAINAAHPFERQQVTLAHEWGHFLTRRHTADVTLTKAASRRSATERFAQAFAYEVLLPATSVIRHFNDLKRAGGGRTSVAAIIELAQVLGNVSVQLLFLRLEALRLIPLGTYERIRHEGFKVVDAQHELGLSPPASDDRLLPRRVTTLAIEAIQRGEITEGLFARFLRIDRVAARRLAVALREEDTPEG
jgi:Zn-dependent peptidase ImmA (M78 family)/DNA-binding XRE family transcriptional regulator